MNKKYLNNKYELSTPNFFEIAKIEEMEIIISNFWAWLLDPNSNHGLEDSFLKEFVAKAIENPIKIKKDTVKIEREYYFKYENDNEKMKKNFIDLVLNFKDEDNKDYIIGIEHKVNSSEGENQTLRYMEGLKKYAESLINKEVIGVYLTKWNFPVKLSSKEFKHIKYYDFNEYFNKILTEELAIDSKVIIEHFKRAILDKPRLKYDYFIENYEQLYGIYKNKSIEFEDNDKILFKNISNDFDYHFCHTIAQYFVFNKEKEDDVFSDVGNSSKSSKSFYQLTRKNWNFEINSKKYTLHLEGSGPNNLNLHFETSPYIPYSKIDKVNKYDEIRKKFRDEFKEKFKKESKYLELKKPGNLSILSFKIGKIDDFKQFIGEINNLIKACNEIIKPIIEDITKS